MLRRAFVIASALLVVGAGMASAPRHVQAATIQATVTYTGNLGPVTRRRPLCLCVYLDANLQQAFGCYISSANAARFQVNAFSGTNYFLTAFLDLDENERLSGHEPFEIYRDRAGPPADPISGSESSLLDITFGDENLPPNATPSPTPTGTLEPAATATPVETSVGGPCVGDCDGSGAVMIDEITTLVSIALGRSGPDACSSGDTNHDDRIEINEIVAAVHSAVGGCHGSSQHASPTKRP